MPEVGGVVHTHSTYATAWAARGEEIPCVLTMMGDEFGGTIPVGPFALIGDDSIGRGIVDTLAQSSSPAVLMQNHGPFTVGKEELREKMLGQMARKHGLPLAWVNQVGGNDDLIFDGRSGAFSRQGRLFARAKGFAEDLVVVDLTSETGTIAKDDFTPETEIWNALVLGVRDYARKTHFKKVLLGLSGGIDSALTAAIAADALGPENVLGVMMPTSISSSSGKTIGRFVSMCGQIGVITTAPMVG